MAGGRQVERVNTLTLGFSIYIPKSLVLSIYKAIRQSLLLVFLLSRSQLSGGIYVHGYRYGVEWYVVLAETLHISVSYNFDTGVAASLVPAVAGAELAPERRASIHVIHSSAIFSLTPSGSFWIS